MIYRAAWSHWILSPLETAQARPAILRAPGQATEIASWHVPLAATWQELGTSRRLWHLPRAHTGILCLPEWWPAFLSHQPGHAALHLCCLSLQVTNSPAERFVLPQLLANLMLLLPSKSSKCFLTAVKKISRLLLFPWPNKPQIHILSHMYWPLSWLFFFSR